MKHVAAFILASTLVVSAIAQSQKPPAVDPRSGNRTATAPEKSTGASSRIRGRVVADGRPVTEASILIFPVNIAANIESAVTTLFRPVTSDADGRFELTSLRPGAYTISVSSPGYILSEQDSNAFYRPGDTITLTLVKGGVITGRVTNSSGDPLIGAVVRAVQVRGNNDRPRARGGMLSQMSEAMDQLLGPFKTDDRGIYRIFGLAPGVYQVAAGGRGAQGFSVGGANPYDSDAPTYYPSSTLDTAADVTVLAGGEASNIDIRYRNNRGYSMSGSVSVSNGAAPQAVSILLTRASSGIVEATSTVLSGRNQNKFAFDSLLDGEYVVTAMGSFGNGVVGPDGLAASLSQSHRVTVRGADVTGIELILEPLASVAGRAVLEPLQAKQKPECRDARSTPLEEVVLDARDQRKTTAVDPLTPSLAEFKNTTPNEKGEFVISLLRPGVQRLEVHLPGENLYLKAITLAPADPNAKPKDVAKSGITLKSGDKVKGLLVTLSEGAAGLRGKVVTGEDNKAPTMKLRVHLVPSEPEAADDVLRYYETEATADGSFSLINLAPGKYWLVAREISDQEEDEDDHKPLAWDAGGRTSLRFEGEASKKVTELGQCQRASDVVLSYTPLIKPAKPAAKKPTQ